MRKCEGVCMGAHRMAAQGAVPSKRDRCPQWLGANIASVGAHALCQNAPSYRVARARAETTTVSCLCGESAETSALDIPSAAIRDGSHCRLPTPCPSSYAAERSK